MSEDFCPINWTVFVMKAGKSDWCSGRNNHGVGNCPALPSYFDIMFGFHNERFDT